MSDVNIIHDYCEEHNISLGKPDQEKKNVLTIPIQFIFNKKKQLAVFQTPKLSMRSLRDDEDDVVHLLFQHDELSKSNQKKMEQFYSYVQSFENNIISKLQSHLNSLFKNQDIDANQLFKSSIHYPNTLDSPCYMSVQISPGFHLFDHKGHPHQLQDHDFSTVENQRVIFVLSCESITITPIQAYINWKIEQAQLQKIKHKKISSKIKHFGITPESDPVDPDADAAEGGCVREADEADTITISLNELKS